MILRKSLRCAATAIGLTMVAGLLTSALTPPAAADRSDAGPQADPWAAAALGTGLFHSCALLTTGRVRCWGWNGYGQLGYGTTETVIGDDENPASAGDVPVGGSVTAVTAGGTHSCALLTTGAVRCWGDGTDGRLGYGNEDVIGDDETPASVGDVPLGGTATAVSAGDEHTCALMDNGRVRCWGANSYGELGYGNDLPVGDNDTVLDLASPDVPLGGTAKAISAGGEHTCALMTSGAVRCWGRGSSGRLGYGNETNIGDNETPASVGDVQLGSAAVAVTAGSDHTCALLTGGSIRCWGNGASGRLGYGNTATVGDDELPASAGPVYLNAHAVAVTTGTATSCAILTSGAVRCWGSATSGKLGYGNLDNIGDNETPATAGNVQVGGRVRAISSGGEHSCVVLEGGTVRCWGGHGSGQLGFGYDIGPNTLGDNEDPDSQPVLDLGGAVRTTPPPPDVVRPTLKLKAKPKRDRTAPFTYRLRGRLSGDFTRSPALCRKQVVITVKQGSRRLVRTKKKLSPTCGYQKKVTIKAKKIRGRSTKGLKITATHPGIRTGAVVLRPSKAKVKVKAR